MNTGTRPVVDSVSQDGGGKIVLLVADGLGGLPHPETGRTELETARTPVLDDLAFAQFAGLLADLEQGLEPHLLQCVDALRTRPIGKRVSPKPIQWHG